MDPIKHVDVAIAGGSLAAVLTAIRLKSAYPGLTLALLEKDNHLGGRQTCLTFSPQGIPTSYGYGLNVISGPLLRYWLQCLQGVSEPSSLEEYSKDPLSLFSNRLELTRMGIVSGGKLTESVLSDILHEKTAKAFGGPAAQREWSYFTDILQKLTPITQDNQPTLGTSEESQDIGVSNDKPAKNQTFGHSWQHPRKSPAAVVLEQIAMSLGIPDLWNATAIALAGRSQRFTSAPLAGPVSSWLDASVRWANLTDSVELSNMILGVRFQETSWEIKCQNNTIVTPRLIVAQSPWNALNWLPKSLWPTPILHTALKTKPVSLVVLCERIETRPDELADLIFIPAEKTQALVLPTSSGSWEISFQATIDYELSMQAPAVIKAVKALKRSRKKLQSLFPGVISEFNHIALQPDAWPNSPLAVDYKWIHALGSKSLSTPYLSFVGDAYGSSHHGDANMISSINQCLSHFSAASP